MSFSGKLSGSARLSAGLSGNRSLTGGVTQSVRYIPGPVGPQGPQGPVGPQGEPGKAFTYSDFTPEQIEALRGPQGIPGPKGEKGDAGQSVTAEVIGESTAGGAGNVVRFYTVAGAEDLIVYNGKDGYTPIKGKDYFDGADGVDGKDGYTPIKGKDYFDGKDGVDGKDGQGVTAEVVAESTVGGAGNVIRFHTADDVVDLTVYNGKDGYTPIKGKDYFDGEDGADGTDGRSIYYSGDTYAWDDGEYRLIDFKDILLDGHTPQTGELIITAAGHLVQITEVGNEFVHAKHIIALDGKDGVDGKDGQGVTAEVVAESTVGGAGNVIRFHTADDVVDLTVYNGKDGVDGYTPVKGQDYFDGEDGKDGVDGYTPVKGIDYFDGVDGYTPVKGIDYYTNAEKAELVDEVTAKVADATGAVGANVAGNDYFIGEETVTAKSGAEIFNDYANNIATGLCAHAEGDTTIARGDASHSEGFFTNAAGKRAHAEGYYTTASGGNSHAEGADTTAGGDSSHAEGYDTTASGNGSHAEGWASIASGAFSHAEGVGTIAAGYGQHVEGRYNLEDVNDEYAHIVGGGARDTERKNIHTVDWDGNAWYAGDLEVKNAVILASPNGTRYKITVSDNGTLSATPVS